MEIHRAVIIMKYVIKYVTSSSMRYKVRLARTYSICVYPLTIAEDVIVHTEKSFRNLIKSDCIYHAPIDLEPNGRPFGHRSRHVVTLK